MFRDKVYFSTLLKISLPLIIQQLIISLANAVDVVMIGQLGETEVAAVGLSNQIFFLLSIMMFGINSAATIFMSQYWGKKDISSIHKIMAISVKLSILGGALFTLIAMMFPEWALGFYTSDAEVIELGSHYLRMAGFCYIPLSIMYSYSFVMRSIENPRLPMITSIIALSLNSGINYLLIFGNFGFPQLGVQGAATATVIARTLEFILLVSLIYARKEPSAAPFSILIRTDFSFVRRFFKIGFPVIINEIFWSFGITTYNAIYAHIGTNSIAAVNIASTIESIAFVTFIGIGNACAVMVGKQIGGGSEKTAILYGKRSIWLTAGSGLIIGLTMIFCAPFILQAYNISEVSRQLAQNIITIAGSVLIIRGMNVTVLIGILRSGGDTRFALFTELFSIWIVGVPLAILGGFVFHFEVHWVYLLVTAEEVIKLVIGLLRFRSMKWINNLVKSPKPELAVETV